MATRFNRKKTLQLVSEINRRLETIEFQLNCDRWGNRYYNYRSRAEGITEFLYTLAGTKWSNETPSVRDQMEAKLETAYKNSVAPDKYNYNEKYTKINTFWKLVEEKREKPIKDMKAKLEKLRSKLLSNVYAAKGKDNKKYIVESLASKIMKGEEEPIVGLLFCTKTGREVKIDFEMRNPNEKDYYKRTKTPTTWFEMGIMKMEGYLFKSHYDKLSHGNKDYWTPNPKTKIGVLKAASKPGASEEMIEAARKLKDRMGDSIYCNYVDSGHVGSFKARELFIFNTPKRRVNKQEYRKNYHGIRRQERLRVDLNRALYTVSRNPSNMGRGYY